jgi:ferredoxin
MAKAAHDVVVERGTGRKLDVDEATAILRQCEEEMLIHVGKCMGCWLCLVTCPETARSPQEARPIDFNPVQ